MNTNFLLAKADEAMAALAKAELDGDLGKVAQARADVGRVQAELQKAKAEADALAAIKIAHAHPVRMAG